jgi:RHS repeat-associated protein
VRYANGEIKLSARDLSSGGFGAVWGQTRSYSNLLTNAQSSVMGNGWIIRQAPYLANTAPVSGQPNQGTIAVMAMASAPEWFVYDGATTSYQAQFGGTNLLRLVAVTGGHEFRHTDDLGQVTRYHDFSAGTPAALRGRFKAFVDAGGNEYAATHDGAGRLESFVQAGTVSTGYYYEYYTAGVNTGRLRYVTLRRGAANVRRASYEYYGSGEGYGNAGDLKRVRVQDYDTGTSGWVDDRTNYYRYYKPGETGGFAGGLRYEVGAEAYRRMVAAGLTPETATNHAVAGYADKQFEYDGQRRVTRERVRGGTATYQNSYATSVFTPGGDFNVWVGKTVETRPDGNQVTVFTNFARQVMFKVFRRVADNKEWYRLRRYDGQGRLVLQAGSSAIASWSEGSAGVATLKASDGLIRTLDYNGNGYPEAEKVKKGSGGTAIKLREWQYQSRTQGGVTRYRISSEVRYLNEAGTETATTAYGYTWHGGTFAVSQVTITLPAVLTAENGSGTSNTRVEVYDIQQRRTWIRDERNFLTRFKYDEPSGGLLQRIDDVNVASISDSPAVPSGWTTPAGGGLHLVTDCEVDPLGRMTQELGPSHAVDLSGTSTTVRRARWRVYKDAQSEAWEGNGYATGSAPSYAHTLVNPVRITKTDSIERPLDEIAAVRNNTAGRLSPADSFPQSTWVRWTSRAYGTGLDTTRVYHLIPASGPGSATTHYGQSDVGYDVMRRAVREKAPGGTITRTVYHMMGWPLETWAGTNDTGATDGNPGGSGGANNMRKIRTLAYDGGNDKGDGNLTQMTLHENASVNRVTGYGYDWRNRRTSVDGEIDFYEAYDHDNLDRVVKVERRNTTGGGALVSLAETFYDRLGRVYRTKQYSSQGTGGPALTSDTWFDAAGNVIKQASPGSRLFQKSEYDSLNRPTRRYQCYDIAESGYAAAGTVTGDTVMMQEELTHDNAGNVVRRVSRERFHDATGTGGLTTPGGAQPKARVRYAALFPDPLGRQKAVADYGTNGGSAPGWPATAPARSDTVLVSSTDYNDRGEAYRTVDPKGIDQRREWDHAGRLTKTIENYVDGVPSGDSDRTTLMAYTLDNQLRTLTAKNSTTGDQVTTWVYGTTLSDSDVARNDLLRAKEFPDKASASDRVEYKHDRLGEVREIKDQLGTVRVLEYDKLGRLLHDRVTTLASGVDGAVRRISRTYEVRGLPETVTSHDHATVGSGGVVNEVRYEYGSFGQATKEYQAHGGAVNTGTSPKVQYGHASGAANTLRPTTLTYPNGRVITRHYGAADSMADVLSRVAALVDSDGPSTQLVAYTYLGLGTTVEASSPQPGIKLTYIQQAGDGSANTGGGDQYTGFDRFGRVIDQFWLKTGSGAVERVQYGFDRNGNRLWRDNLVAGTNEQDEHYTYDGLQQLLTLDRGNLNAGRTAISGTPSWEEDFAFDPTGNWDNYLTKVTGTTALNQNRTHNPANEILTLSGSSTLVAFNAAGNMTKAPKTTNWASAYDLVWDAWNRLAQVKDGATTVAAYAYDGLTRRVTKTTGGTTRHFYYSAQWQILEERVGASTAAQRQFVWGERYPDDLVLRDRDTDGNGSLDERLYVQHDYFHPTAVSNTSGAVQERYGYDAYGLSRVMTPAFGARSPSSYDWETRYGAYRWDSETGLYQVRHRYLHPTLGRWLSRDPIGEMDGVNIYVYVSDNSINRIDHLGLSGTKCAEAIGKNGQPRIIFDPAPPKGGWKVSIAFGEREGSGPATYIDRIDARWKANVAVLCKCNNECYKTRHGTRIHEDEEVGAWLVYDPTNLPVSPFPISTTLIDIIGGLIADDILEGVSGGLFIPAAQSEANGITSALMKLYHRRPMKPTDGSWKDGKSPCD